MHCTQWLILKPHSGSSPLFFVWKHTDATLSFSYPPYSVSEWGHNECRGVLRWILSVCERPIKRLIHSSWCGWTASGHMFYFEGYLESGCSLFYGFSLLNTIHNSPSSLSLSLSFSHIADILSRRSVLNVKWISRTVKAHYGALPSPSTCLRRLIGMVVGTHRGRQTQTSNQLFHLVGCWRLPVSLNFKNLAEMFILGRRRWLALVFEGYG